MPKLFWKLLTGLLIVLPQWVLAGGVDLGKETTEIFRLDPTDPTKGFLGQIFGSVGTVLSGTSGQLLGQLFKIFNIGILVVAGVFFVWAISQTIMSTAHEGQFMGGGGKSKPAYTMLRTVAGFGLLVPNFNTGYSMIQGLVMWVILQGVGFANTAWNEAMDYFEEGGVALVKPSQAVNQLVDLGGVVLASQVCMYYFEKDQKDLQTTAPAGSPNAEYFPQYRPKWGGTYVSFPKARGNKDTGCGQFSWATGNATKDQYIRSAIQQMVIDTQTAAQRIVDPGTYSSSDIRRITEDSVISAAANFINITLPIRNMKPPGTNMAQFFTQARADGWLYAGSYYFKLTGIQAKFSSANTLNVYNYINKNISGLVLCSGGTCRVPTIADASALAIDQSAPAILQAQFKALASNVATAREKAAQIDATARGIPRIGSLAAGALAPILSPVTDGITESMGAIGGSGAGEQETGIDPVLKLKRAGEIMVGVIITVMVIGTALVATVSAIASLMSSVNSAGYVFRDIITFVLAFLIPLMMMVLIEGQILAAYVPLIPFIIWTFGVIGWFIIVIETLVAAPIVALGLTHPEGHDLMGASQQALMLLLNVFLRPILMIIGLFAGMILSKIGLQLLSNGFVNMLGTGSVNAFFVLALLFVFIALVIQLLTVTYGLINHVPDRVMRWIGLQDAGSGAAAASEALGAAKQATTSVAESGAKGMEGGMAKAGTMGDKSADMEKEKQKQMSAGGDSGKGGGGKGGGGMSFRGVTGITGSTWKEARQSYKSQKKKQKGGGKGKGGKGASVTKK